VFLVAESVQNVDDGNVMMFVYYYYILYYIIILLHTGCVRERSVVLSFHLISATETEERLQRYLVSKLCCAVVTGVIDSHITALNVGYGDQGWKKPRFFRKKVFRFLKVFKISVYK